MYWIEYGKYKRIGKEYLEGSGWKKMVKYGIRKNSEINVDMLKNDV
jgi:hypothetical protein